MKSERLSVLMLSLTALLAAGCSSESSDSESGANHLSDSRGRSKASGADPYSPESSDLADLAKVVGQLTAANASSLIDPDTGLVTIHRPGARDAARWFQGAPPADDIIWKSFEKLPLQGAKPSQTDLIAKLRECDEANELDGVFTFRRKEPYRLGSAVVDVMVEEELIEFTSPDEEKTFRANVAKAEGKIGYDVVVVHAGGTAELLHFGMTERKEANGSVTKTWRLYAIDTGSLSCDA
jgi:hypothetical protein